MPGNNGIGRGGVGYGGGGYHPNNGVGFRSARGQVKKRVIKVLGAKSTGLKPRKVHYGLRSSAGSRGFFGIDDLKF